MMRSKPTRTITALLQCYSACSFCLQLCPDWCFQALPTYAYTAGKWALIPCLLEATPTRGKHITRSRATKKGTETSLGGSYILMKGTVFQKNCWKKYHTLASYLTWHIP